MKKKRLIAFGCSLTFGFGLPDCWDPPYNNLSKPSSVAWPNLIADALDRDCVNRSMIASSNKRIWHEIANFDFEDDDLVFVMWSQISRTSILESKYKIQNIGTWMMGEKAWANMYYRIMNREYDDEITTALYISHANYIFNRKKIESYHLAIDRKNTNCFNLLGENINHIPLYMLEYEENYPIALDDDHHTGVEGHAALARDILKYLDIDSYIKIPEQKKLTFFQKIKKQCKRITKEIKKNLNGGNHEL